MLAVLQIIVGIVFVLLLLSLLGTTVMEIVSGALALRGRHLFKSLQNMLGEKFYDFVTHPFYRQMMEDAAKDQIITRRALPSYISPQTFRAIFLDVLRNKTMDQQHIAHHIENLKDGELKDLLRFLLRDAKGDQDAFEYKIDQWFNQVMDRVSGWYKRTTRYWLVSIGFFIAVCFNADTINIYQTLTADASLRSSINVLAQEYAVGAQNNQMKQPLVPSSPNAGVAPITTVPQTAVSPTTSKSKVDIAKYDQYTSVLGLGWGKDNIEEYDMLKWLTKLAGWLVTALAVSLGAGFWFDALRRLVNINSTSSAPAAPAAPAKGGAKEDEGDG